MQFSHVPEGLGSEAGSVQVGNALLVVVVLAVVDAEEVLVKVFVGHGMSSVVAYEVRKQVLGASVLAQGSVKLFRQTERVSE